MSTTTDDILKQVDLKALAAQMGTTQKEAKSAAAQVITSLLGGMTANAQSDEGEQSLAAALQAHAGGALAQTTGKISPDAVDTADGSKIAKKVLGTDVAGAAKAISTATGTQPSLLEKLLPILAPIVMAYLGSKVTGGSVLGSVLGAGAGGGIGQVLGGVLGGGTQKQTASSGGLADILGGMLGGGATQQAAAPASGGGLADMLGGLFGGGAQQTAPAQQPAQQQSSGGVLGGLLDKIF